MCRKKISLVALLCVFEIFISFLVRFDSKVSQLKQNMDEPVTLRVLTCGSSNQKACNRISKALSQITLKRYGFAVELEQVGLSEYSNTINRKQMLNQVPDLFQYTKQNDLAGYVKKNAVVELNGLMKAEGVSLFRQISKDVWDTATLFNNIYAVPAINGSSYSLGFMARKDIVDILGVTPSNIKDLDSLHRLLLRVRTGYPDMVPVVSHFGQVIPVLGEDPLGDDLGVLMDENQQTVENLFSSNTYYEMCQRMHQWYNEGLILESAYSYDESSYTLFKAFNGFGFFVRLNEYAAPAASRSTGSEMIAFQLSEPILNTSNYNLGWCISSTTVYAGQAMQLLSLLYNDREIADLCIYGQEGIDYTRLNENTVIASNKKDINIWNTIAWAWPNRNIASNWKQGNSDGKPDKKPDGIKISRAMGFVFDSSPIQRAVDQCNSVVGKYNNALLSGYLDPDQAIPRFLQELKAAGLDKVIANKKYQLNVWFENKNR